VGPNLEELGLPNKESLLADLGDIFTKEEVWEVIKDLPPNGAPRPDGFMGAFYQKT
jgi:hypothetical protein